MQTCLKREQPADNAGSDIMPDKFKSGEQLLRAYEALEAAFTRKSQKLKELLEENARLRGELEGRTDNISGVMEEFKSYTRRVLCMRPNCQPFLRASLI